MADETFGRYQIKGQLGRGGMATVYYAYDPRFQRDVVIKVLPRELMADEAFHARFVQEAQVSARIDHPAIVPVYDVGEENGQPYLVMRYMSGGSLEDRIRRGPLSLTEIARIVGRIAPALDEAHAKGMLHRDIKPSNILFDQRDDAYLADLGIVALQESASNITGSGPVGTPLYMAPELSMPRGLSHLADIYALGVTLFQMVTGDLPYDAPTPMGVIMAHATQPIPNVRDRLPYLPESVQYVVEKALAKEPYQRYQSVSAMAADLEAVVSGRPLPSTGAADATMIEGAYPADDVGATLLDQAPVDQAAGATMIEQPPAYDATLMDTAPSAASASSAPTRPVAVVPPEAGEPTRPAKRAAQPEKPRKKKRSALDTALGVIILLIVILLATAGLILTGTLDPLLQGRLGLGGGSPTAVIATQEQEPTEEPVVVEEEEPTETPTEEQEPTEEEAEPSRTPRPTNTPRPTATDEPEPTSGPTSSAPTSTPQPVSTATPVPVSCPAGSEPSGDLCLVSYQSNADSFQNACARCPEVCAGAETVFISCSPGIELSDGKYSAFCSCALP